MATALGGIRSRVKAEHSLKAACPIAFTPAESAA
jgi:hypothetical protein